MSETQRHTELEQLKTRAGRIFGIEPPEPIETEAETTKVAERVKPQRIAQFTKVVVTDPGLQHPIEALRPPPMVELALSEGPSEERPPEQPIGLGLGTEEDEQNELVPGSILTAATGTPQTFGEVWDEPRPSTTHLAQTIPALVLGKNVDQEITRHRIFQLYLRGYSNTKIGERLDITPTKVRHHFRKIQRNIVAYMEENPQVFGTPLQNIYTQVLRRRERQSQIWEEIEDLEDLEDGGVRFKNAFYKLIAEEDQAIERMLGLNAAQVLKVYVEPPPEPDPELLQSEIEGLTAPIQELGPAALARTIIDIREVYSRVTHGEQIGPTIIEGEVSGERGDQVGNTKK